MTPPNLRLGTIGWSYNFWKGPFYPQKEPSKQYLNYYSTKFGTVEVDSTFYRLPTEPTVANWKQQTPKSFKFALKFPGYITHVKKLKDVELQTDTFLSRLKLLGEKLGPLLLQFPPNFTADHYADLERYLQTLPKTNRYVVEVRDKSWLVQDLYSLLSSYNVALAWADSPRDLVVRELTSDFLYIRWEGDRAKVNGLLGKIEADKKGDLQIWAKELKPYLEKGTEVFGYFGKYYSGLPPSDAVTLTQMLS